MNNDDIFELFPECHEIAKSKGWWDEHKRPGYLARDEFAIKCDLIDSERAEAFECVMAGQMDLSFVETDGQLKPIGYPSEIADIVIRIADLFGWILSGPIAPWRQLPSPGITMSTVYSNRGTFTSLRRISELCLEAGSFNDFGFEELTTVIRLCQHQADEYSFVLYDVMRLKMDYNRTRSYRHGGKVLWDVK